MEIYCDAVDDEAHQTEVPVGLLRQIVSWSRLRNDGLDSKKLERHLVWMQGNLSLSPMQVIEPFAACGAVSLLSCHYYYYY